MAWKKQIRILLSLLAAAIFLIYVLNSIKRYDYSCISNLKCALSFKSLFFDYFYAFSVPILSILPLLCILLFTNEAIYKSWRNFSIVFLPVAAFLIASAQETCGAIVCLLTREAVTLYMSILFLIISFSIIAIKSWRLRGKLDKKGS